MQLQHLQSVLRECWHCGHWQCSGNILEQLFITFKKMWSRPPCPLCEASLYEQHTQVASFLSPESSLTGECSSSSYVSPCVFISIDRHRHFFTFYPHTFDRFVEPWSKTLQNFHVSCSSKITCMSPALTITCIELWMSHINAPSCLGKEPEDMIGNDAWEWFIRGQDTEYGER